MSARSTVSQASSPVLFLVACLFANVAGANEAVHSHSFPLQTLPWNGLVQLPRFDPDLGQLVGATIVLSSSIDGSAALENTSAQAVAATYMPSGWVTSSFPFGWIPPLNPAYDYPSSYALASFDGSLDFGGASGFSVTFAHASGQGNPSFQWGGSGSFFSVFLGPAGQPGTFSFAVDASDATSLAGLPPGVVESRVLAARVTVTLRYQYETFASHCEPGSAGVLACPCANPPGFAGRGCDNSAGTGGALLSGLGNSTLSADSFRLRTLAETASALSIVLQGDATIPSGGVFGQGVRCVGGNLLRLYVLQASGGSITAGAPTLPSISSVSAALGDPLVPGAHRQYMVYYRDPIVLGGCPASATFNATQALDVRWEP
jgi:hypothetical protein